MKFAKLVRPLFLVALGLHGLALFLPTGNDAGETAEVEVAAGTLAAGPQADPIDRLPIPELNATAENNNAPVGALGAAIASGVLPASKPAAIQQSVPVRPAAVATAPNPTTAPATAPVVPASPVTPASAASTMPTSVLPVLPPSDLPTSDLPTSDNVSNQDSEDAESADIAVDSTADDPSGATDSAASSQSNRSLIASAITQLPDSLKLLMNRWAIALTYDPKRTSDRSAKAAKEKWTDTINAQAGSSSIVSLEPEQVEDFAKLSYPIESSQKQQEQSFRVCLAQPPSPAAVGILFDSQGEIVGEPEVIRSTGYDALNDEIVAIVKASKNLPETRSSKAFVFEVAVDYNKQTCTSLAELKN